MSWSCERINFEELKPASAAEDYALHLAAVEWSLAEPIVISSKDDIKSKGNWRDNFEPYLHQVENLIRFCRMLPVTLLADDVGLGKTISAGLVLSELMERKRVARALVIAPAILGPQWVEELASKFGIPGVFATGQALADAVHRSAVPVVVTTYQTASSRIEGIRADQFDMLILDEAHKLRNLHGTQHAPRMATRIRNALESRLFKYVLMLTATPIQNRIWDLYSLIDLLTVAKGHRNPLGTPGEFRARFITDAAGRRLNALTADEFRSILRQYVVRTRREDARLVFPERMVETRKLRGGSVESRMQELVAREIGKLSGLVQISISQAMMSSPQALASQLANMAAKGSVSQDLADEARRLAEAQPRTAKLEGLLKLVRQLRADRPSDWRLVVFTLRKETQDAIGRALVAEGVAVDYIRGGAHHATQSTVARFRTSPPQVNVIVSTDAGAEGVNLQSGNVLVNYDLPWNPMIMEQRIGRIQRLTSTHENVIVVNLVVANSVEERIVGRLMEKLQSVSETIGDIETILESTGQDDDSSFEEMVRRLVVSSLTGQNVEEATEAATKSIEEAKQRMAEEKETIADVFGAGAMNGSQGPKPPKFEPVAPSIPAEAFARRALIAEGATLRDRGDGSIDVIWKGRASERITFKPEVAEQEDAGVFMGNAPRLCLPGRPYFERLVERWRQRSEHSVYNLSANTDASMLLASKAWCETVPDAAFESFNIESSTQFTNGGVVCRVKAANGVDSLEKLLHIGTRPPDHGAIETSTIQAASILSERLTPDFVFNEIEALIRSNAGNDGDIDEFCKFYEERRREDIGKAGNDYQRRHKIETDFSPKLFADVVAMMGVRYDVVRASIAFLLDREHRYEANVELVPASQRTLDEPARKTCQITERVLPVTCLQQCDRSKLYATAHLMVKSSLSGRFAMPEYGIRCDVTGEILLNDEILKSDYSGKVAAATMFKRSALSGRRGLKDEFVNCDVTGISVLPDELVMSEVSGVQFRQDHAARSAVSGKVGYHGEFVTCQESGDTILPDEAGASAVSGKVVRRDLLVPSEKLPNRLGLKDETQICSLSGATLLYDEVVTSAVSGKLVDKELATVSDLSGRPCLPSESVRCQVSGQTLLPDEAGVSSISRKTVRRDLLSASAISGQLALPDEMKTCEITGAIVLPEELVESGESGRRFRRDQAVTSAESGRTGHQTEAILCHASGETVLRSESGVSAISGKDYRKSLLRASDKSPHRLGTADEFRVCAKSGKQLLSDEVEESAVSGVPIDRDLAAFSDVSRKPALPEEMMRCEESGRSVLPAETGRSDLSNRLVCSDLLHKSPISERLGLKEEFKTCELTGASVLADELKTSDESGRPFRIDEAVTSSESGRTAHRSEAIQCAKSKQYILKSEAGESTITKKWYSKSLLGCSEKSSGRFDLKEDLVTCARSGKRLLTDEVGKSEASNKIVDRDLLRPSARTGRLALEEELVVCAETGKHLLPDEVGLCAITSKRVDKAILGASELSGKTALASLLEPCAVSGRMALPTELRACEVSGKRVDPSELEVCSVSHKRAVRYQFVQSDISGVQMLPEHAVWSPVSKRCCTPQESVECAWRGVMFPKDEVATCRLTGLTFSREFMNTDNEFRILRELLDGRESGADGSDLVGWLTHINVKTQGSKAARCVFSPDGSTRAICGEIRAMMGFKVRYAGLLVSERGERKPLGRVVIGKRSDKLWMAEA